MTKRVSWKVELPSVFGPIRLHASGPLNGSEQVVIVLHGMDRSASQYLRQGVEALPEAIVLAPEFDRFRFPGWRSFNLARMKDRDNRDLERRETLFPILEAIADYARGLGGKIAVYGHSAGAQLLLRWMLFEPEVLTHARLVAANPGWTTALEPAVSFPYGLKAAPLRPQPEAALALDLQVVAGADDTKEDHSALRRDAGADRQGTNRRDRALFFVRTAQEAARGFGIDTLWSLRIAASAGHSNSAMLRTAAPIILGPRTNQAKGGDD